MAEPIIIPCEGSGAVSPHHLCPMCGQPYPQGEPIPDHTRQDILAMLGRGDFGPIAPHPVSDDDIRDWAKAEAAMPSDYEPGGIFNPYGDGRR